MFRFAHPDYFIFLIVLPLLAVLFYYGLIVKSRRLDKLGEKRLLSALMPEVSHWRPRVRFLSSFIALTLIVFVMAGPQFGTKLETVKRKGIEVMVAIDVSNSMLSQDLKPSRMQRAKQILSRVIDGLDNDKVGLIVFAGDSVTDMGVVTVGRRWDFDNLGKSYVRIIGNMFMIWYFEFKIRIDNTTCNLLM